MNGRISVAEQQRCQRQSLLTEQETAAQLRIQPQTLRKWRLTGEGLKFVRLKRGLIRYRQADVDTFIERGLCTSTSEGA